MAKVQNRIEQLEEEKREAKLNEEQIDEMKQTALEMKKSQIQNNV